MKKYRQQCVIKVVHNQHDEIILNTFISTKKTYQKKYAPEYSGVFLLFCMYLIPAFVFCISFPHYTIPRHSQLDWESIPCVANWIPAFAGMT